MGEETMNWKPVLDALSDGLSVVGFAFPISVFAILLGLIVGHLNKRSKR